MPARSPLVSILTPSFDQGRFLRDCLGSVARQSYPRVEHVVMDGGSTDESLQILAESGDAVSWTSEPDRGQADAVNKAFAASAGDIVGWINSDDGLFALETIERVVAAFTAHPEAGVIYGDAALVTEGGRIVRHYRSHWQDGSLPLVSPIAQPAAFFRRSVVEPGECLLRADLYMFLDYELWLRLRNRGVRFVHLPAVLAVDRDHPQRKIRENDEIFIRETARLVEEYGPVFAAPRLGRLGSVSRRLRGVAEVWGWEKNEAAFPWHVDGRLPRMARQLARPDPVRPTAEWRRFARNLGGSSDPGRS